MTLGPGVRYSCLDSNYILAAAAGLAVSNRREAGGGNGWSWIAGLKATVEDP